MHTLSTCAVTYHRAIFSSGKAAVLHSEGVLSNHNWASKTMTSCIHVFPSVHSQSILHYYPLLWESFFYIQSSLLNYNNFKIQHSVVRGPGKVVKQ